MIKIDQKETKDHWLELVEVESQPDGTEDIWQRIVVKWDGCIHYRRYYNTPANFPGRDPRYGDDYLHICELDKFIKQLQKVKEMAKAHFGEWPG